MNLLLLNLINLLAQECAQQQIDYQKIMELISMSACKMVYVKVELIDNIRNMLGGERHAVVLNQPLRGGRFNQRQTALLNTLVQPVRDFIIIRRFKNMQKVSRNMVPFEI